MTVAVEGMEIRLTGRCGVEEAETLLAALHAAPESRVVLAAERVHTSRRRIRFRLSSFSPGSDEMIRHHEDIPDGVP
jgi:hypothetical protein